MTHHSSKLKVVNLETGAVLQQVDLSRQYFGEGVTRHGKYYFQLTWQSGKVFVYSVADLKLVRTGTLATTTGQGWGITSDGVHLIVSDGSSHIMFVDSESLEVVRRVTVCCNTVGRVRPPHVTPGPPQCRIAAEAHQFGSEPGERT